MSRGARGLIAKLIVQDWAEEHPVQILVVVAHIQTRALKTEVEKGSM